MRTNVNDLYNCDVYKVDEGFLPVLGELSLFLIQAIPLFNNTVIIYYHLNHMYNQLLDRGVCLTFGQNVSALKEPS